VRSRDEREGKEVERSGIKEGEGVGREE